MPLNWAKEVLDHHHAHALFDGPDPERSVAPRPGEHDPYRLSILVVGKVPEETVDGHPETVRPDRFQVPDGAVE